MAIDAAGRSIVQAGIAPNRPGASSSMRSTAALLTARRVDVLYPIRAPVIHSSRRIGTEAPLVDAQQA
jgi:hypothetical protein